MVLRSWERSRLARVWSSFLKWKVVAFGTPGFVWRELVRFWIEREWWIDGRVSGMMVTFFSPSARRKSSNLFGSGCVSEVFLESKMSIANASSSI